MKLKLPKGLKVDMSKLVSNPYKVGEIIHCNASGGYYGLVKRVEGDCVVVSDPRDHSESHIHWTNVSVATEQQYNKFVLSLQPIPGADVKGNAIGVGDSVEI